MKIFSRKDRKIANLEAKIKNRDILIEDQQRLIDTLRIIINSKEDDLQALKEQSFENAKKVTKKTTKKTKKEAE